MDEITDEAIKENIYGVTPLIMKICNICKDNNAMPTFWMDGIITYIRKKRQSRKPKNLPTDYT